MVGALLACTATQILATNEADTETEIRWTTFGVPHIKAANERGLGYGIGYAYARDNLCLLEEEIVTARGERSRFFGPDGKSSARIANVPSDFFFRWLNDDAAVEGFWVAQPVAIQQLLEGYAAGFNRYLNDTPEAEQPAACAGSDWLRPIASADLIRLARRLIVEGGLGNFVEALIAAAPPGQEQIASTNLHLDFAQAARRRAQFGEQTGSNAVAIGSDLSDNGKGILLGNPHFPWSGAARFYQMHLTIPGKLDVMGAALPGMPVINIGFNQHFAWSHTVDTSSHFTLQRLQLDPQDSSRYLVDGQSRPLEKRIVNIEVRNEDGMLANLEHTLYLSEYGPLLNWPGLLGWDDKTAYALQDANLDNTRAIQQWVAMNEATSLAEFKASIERLQGIPWVNTLAADDRGRTLYMNTAVMPNVTLEQTADCLDKAMAKEGLPVLDGSRSACRWTVDKEAAQPGIMPVSQQPVLERRDFVQNSNSSAWMTNPAAPLTGFSPLISQAKELNPRTRFGLTQLARLAKGKITPQQLEHMVTANQVYMANVLMANLLTLCQADQAPQDVCTSFHRWNRQANLGDNARALLYFQRFMTHFQEIPAAWRVPFNPADPIGTPRGILLSKPHVKEQVLQALHIARDEVNELGIAEHAAWGEVQKSSRGDEQIPIPGGGSNLGVYNAIESQPEGDSYLEVIGGSSHIQLVRFTDAGPQARGILSFSQSADPTSSHNRDQTLRFSRQQWHTLPFTEEQINASLSAPVLLLSE
nr:acylase [Azomonas macrocytogenes]